jgi:hypothetical protein
MFDWYNCSWISAPDHVLIPPDYRFEKYYWLDNPLFGNSIIIPGCNIMKASFTSRLEKTQGQEKTGLKEADLFC